jgi:pullulanase
MILAGDEFADQHSRFDQFGNVTQDGGKQVDPVSYGRLEGSDDITQMRQRILAYVSRLVKLRTSSPALGVNDNNFIQVDFNGKRVLAWTRGASGMDPVVILANFSDFASAPGTDYVVNGWPATPPGKQWREVTQDRIVPPDWIGREPIFPWEAKVYTTFS